MKYQWTDWITHIPGQELPNGAYALFEFHGRWRNGGEPYQSEGIVTPKMRGHRSWYATHSGERGYAMIRRYKLRSVAEENVMERKRELETTP